MKKLLSIVGILLGSIFVLAQVPEKMSYQAVIRNSSGELLQNQNVAVKVSVLQDSETGTLVYSETLTGTTNDNGLISLQIGSGIILSGTFDTIDWSLGNYFLKTETDPTGGTNYTISGSSQLLSVPFAMYAKNSGTEVEGFTLPFETTENNVSTLFSIGNDGDGTSIEGINNSTTSNISAVRGIVNSTSPGEFSAGVLGINNGTDDLGIGVWGSHAGSGWGVYGTAPDGFAVHGDASESGTGVQANSNTGIGLAANSISGTALYANGNSGITAKFENVNADNISETVSISSNGMGKGLTINLSNEDNAVNALEINHSGDIFSGGGILVNSNGPGIFVNSTERTGVEGITNSSSSAGIIGRNDTGEGVVGFSSSDISGAVVGRSDGDGFGVRGFNTQAGIGVFGQAGISGGTGIAAKFENVNADNISETVSISSNGMGKGLTINLSNEDNDVNALEINHSGDDFGSVGILVNSISEGISVNSIEATAIVGTTNSSFSAGIIGRNETGEAIVGFSSSDIGGAVVGRSDGDGFGVRGFNTQAGIGVFGQAGLSGGTGISAKFENVNADNNSETVVISSNGIGKGLAINLSNEDNGANAIEINHAGFGFGILVNSDGGNGVVGISGSGIGVSGLSNENGFGVSGFNSGNGIGVFGRVGLSGGTGKAARFENVNSSNTTNVFEVSSNSTANLAVFIKSGNNVARIDQSGKAFFNGGTQNSGADIAEAFDVEGDSENYEPGDILIISTKNDRLVEKSSEPYSHLVAGVYATKPGVLLTEENIDSNLEGKVPMGIIGVIPTKVCLEGGEIKRGDLLVTSSISGVAMKADLDKVKVGQVIGKALQEYNSEGLGKINVLVSVK